MRRIVSRTFTKRIARPRGSRRFRGFTRAQGLAAAAGVRETGEASYSTLAVVGGTVTAIGLSVFGLWLIGTGVVLARADRLRVASSATPSAAY